MAAQGQRTESRGVWSGDKASNLKTDAGIRARLIRSDFSRTVASRPTSKAHPEAVLAARTSHSLTVAMSPCSHDTQQLWGCELQHRSQSSSDLFPQRSTTTQLWVIAEHCLNEVWGYDVRVCKQKWVFWWSCWVVFLWSYKELEPCKSADTLFLLDFANQWKCMLVTSWPSYYLWVKMMAGRYSLLLCNHVQWRFSMLVQKYTSNFQSFTVCADIDGTLQSQQDFTYSTESCYRVRLSNCCLSEGIMASGHKCFTSMVLWKHEQSGARCIKKHKY